MSLLNTGLIQATVDDRTTQHSTGVLFYNTGPVSIENSGTIRGDYAIREGPPTSIHYVYAVTIKNSGLLDGRIAFTRVNQIYSASACWDLSALAPKVFAIGNFLRTMRGCTTLA